MISSMHRKTKFGARACLNNMFTDPQDGFEDRQLDRMHVASNAIGGGTQKASSTARCQFKMVTSKNERSHRFESPQEVRQ